MRTSNIGAFLENKSLSDSNESPHATRADDFNVRQRHRTAENIG